MPPSSQAVKGVNLKPPRIVLPQWQFTPGPLNAITDVAGVKVGHTTVNRDYPTPIRTGVTAIIPHSGNLATYGLWASGVTLNGNGEMTGMGPLQTNGILNSPIVLTNTFSVGAAHQGVFQYFNHYYPGQWSGQLPVIGECYDGYFNTIEDLSALSPQDTVKAMLAAEPGPFAQGRVGAGTGMRSFELHAGIGSSSRRVWVNGRWYTIGVLVNANHSRLENLNPTIKTELEKRFGPLESLRARDSQDRVPHPPRVSPRQGSIITVIATDLPLNPSELKQLAQRAGLGIGATGSTMDTTSGDYAIAFSTAQAIDLNQNASPMLVNTVIHPDALSSVYRATVEAVTEAQINALQASHL